MRQTLLARSIPVLAGAFASIAAPASADFLGFASTSTVVEGEFDTYHVLEVYALFDDPTDRLLNIFDVHASLGRPGFPGSKVPLFHASNPDEEIPATMLPLGFLPPGEQWLFDTYVTIGARQGNFLNGTVADPDFDDSAFTQNSNIDGAGWYNLPPTNAYGLAGAEQRVFLGQFTVTEADFQAGLRLEFSATIGYASSGALAFASHAKHFYYRAPGAAVYAADKIDSDVNGDLVFVNRNARLVASWLMDGLVRKESVPIGGQVPSGWKCQAIGDLDGNGTADLLWRDVNTGRIHAWLLENAALLQSVQISGPIGSNWTIVGIGDISGDARGDIILRNRTTGAVEGWLMDGAMRLAVGTIGASSGLVPQYLGDLDGDGLHDIIWRTKAGAPRLWLLDGLTRRFDGPIAGLTTNVGTAWKIAGTGDIDGNGTSDILWRHTSGAVVAWMMDGATRTEVATVHAGVGSKWRIETLRDLDGDGRHDLVLRNSLNGDVYGWLMEGTSLATSGFVRNVSLSWKMVDP
jgi:hypothetical protein